MRVREEVGNLSVQAIAGNHVVLLGMDIADSAKDGLLGFAIERVDRETDRGRWLPNFLRFEVNQDAAGWSSTQDNPVQAFVWGDYAVEPGAALLYRVTAMYGQPGALEPGDTVSVSVDVEHEHDGQHGIYFNRGVAGSQRYTELFTDASPLGNPAALEWLSRGLFEAFSAFIGEATGPGHSLRGAFYEFAYAPALELLAEAARRGVDVELAVAHPENTEDEWILSRSNEAAVNEAQLADVVAWRRSSKGIPHNKFLVRLEDGEPTDVWTGSTNITDGGIFGQSNVGHAVRSADVARAYLDYWKQLHADTETAPLRVLVDQENPVPEGEPPANETSHMFSPRRGERALHWYAQRMRAAKESIFFTAPFGVSQAFEKEVLLDPAIAVPRYVLLEKPDNNMEALRADPHNQLVAGAYLGKGRWRQFLKESLTGLNERVRYIHTKYLLIDPLSDDPVVITGSANFSGGSVSTNDENMLVIRGDKRVADIYLSEFMRLFTHMRFRAKTTTHDTDPTPSPAAQAEATPFSLEQDERWTKPWFDPDNPKCKERLLFR